MVDRVRGFSPPLADLYAVDSGAGARAIADQIERLLDQRAVAQELAGAGVEVDGDSGARVRGLNGAAGSADAYENVCSYGL